MRKLSDTVSKQTPVKCVAAITIWDRYNHFGFAEIETPTGPVLAYIPNKIVSRLSSEVEPLAYYSVEIVDNPREVARDGVPYMVVSIDVVNIPSDRQIDDVYLVEGSSEFQYKLDV